MTKTRIIGEFPVFDIHAHVFPAKILDRAVVSIGTFYDLNMQMDGTLDTLMSQAIALNISKSAIFSTATRKSQVSSIHQFIHDVVADSNGRFIGFGTLHQEMSAAEIQEEIEHIDALGLRGIKLHPDFQSIAADSDEVFAMAEAAEDRLPILFHAGDYRYDFSHPEQIAKLAVNFPKLTIIAAHFGGWSEWYKSPEILSKYENVVVDTSSSMAFMSDEMIRSLINAFGTDRVLFGTDYPMWNAKDEIQRLLDLGYTDEEYQKIFMDNARAITKS